MRHDPHLNSTSHIILTDGFFKHHFVTNTALDNIFTAKCAVGKCRDILGGKYKRSSKKKRSILGQILCSSVPKVEHGGVYTQIYVLSLKRGGITVSLEHPILLFVLQIYKEASIQFFSIKRKVGGILKKVLYKRIIK